MSAPFRYFVLDDFWDSTLLRMVHKEVSRVDEAHWRQTRFTDEAGVVIEEKRFIDFCWCEETLAIVELRNLLAGEPWLSNVGSLLGVEKLHFDPLGGGLHRIVPGGLLKTHVDFNVDDHGRWRRANALVYLNSCGPGGELKLYGDDDSVPFATIEPRHNRTVVFECTETSWHGHPTPLAAGPDRLSVAAYYFTHEKPADAAPKHSTVFRRVGGDAP